MGHKQRCRSIKMEEYISVLGLQKVFPNLKIDIRQLFQSEVEMVNDNSILFDWVR